jgi:hypothetical protein
MDIMISAATHRSGSTLVQRIFNIRKKTLIWGEQDGLLTRYYQIHRNLQNYAINHAQQRTNYFDNQEDPNHWIACMTPEISHIDKAVTDSLRLLFHTLYEQPHREGHDTIGFKEVRYGENELTLFRKCYPQAKIILLVRDPLHVWKSMKGSGLAGNAANFAKKWHNNASYYLQLNEKNPNVHLFKYEDIVSKNPETLEYLSQLADISSEEIDSVLAKKIFSTPREMSNAEWKTIVNACGETMKRYGYWD